MLISRRAFTAGAASLAIARPAFAATAVPPQFAAALAAITAAAEDLRRTVNLPGLTLGLTAPGGFSQVLNLGFANADARRPITAETLFQIGSISKAMTAVLLHQLAAEGPLDLNADVRSLMPDLPLPRRERISVQHLIDHVSGLPDNAPLFTPGGLWLGFKPGEHWHYSNTGYEILGKLAEHAGGKPLARLLEERLFRPLGMTRSRGAIVGADRPRYAIGYEAADMLAPYVRGAPLAPAAWVDVTFGAGSVASTAADMILFMRSLIDAAQGRGGLGLGAAQGRALVSHSVASEGGMRYGNGLMHVSEGGRSFLHHTGGMVSFSSAFHVDPVSGVGAFASSNVSGLLGFRPRKLTSFAARALAAALEYRAPPPAPALVEAVRSPAEFAGAYRGAREAEVRAGPELMLVSGGRAAPLELAGPDLFRTGHPDFREFALQFERSAGKVVALSWGAETLLRAGAGGTMPKSDPALARLAGRYVNDSPWGGALHVVERGGRLWAGTDTPLHPVGP